MGMSNKSNLETGKRNEESSNYNSPGMSGDWQFNNPSFADSSMGIVPNVNAMVASGEGIGASSSSGAMVDSFVQTMWEHSVNPASVGYNEMNVNSGMFVPNLSDVLAHNMSQFPADAAFIERAARFSSFSGGHFGELWNPYGAQQSASSYLRGGTMMQDPHGVLSGNAMKTSPYIQPQNNDPNVIETSKDVSVPVEDGSVEGGSAKNRTMVERSHGESKQRVSMSGNDSDEPEFSGGDAREGAAISPFEGFGPKKRKRDAESEQGNGTQLQSGDAGKKNSEIQQGEQNPSPLENKSNGKHGKQNSQNSDPAKDEYIHMRARRGQATNSHSLAERVRREKISERMKFLQDLVPGCSKVTGKAVMLDEIINYVQSLQRQVEFLSMKLATVNPRLDFNMDQLLAKDPMLSARSGPSGIGISPSLSMAYPALHPSQAPILQPGLPGLGNFSDMLRRTVNSQLPNMGGGYKEPTQHLPNSWDDELHNVVQMRFNASPPPDNQEANCQVDQGPTTADP